MRSALVRVCNGCEVKLRTAVTSSVVTLRLATVVVGVGRLRQPHAVEMSLEAYFSTADSKASARFTLAAGRVYTVPVKTVVVAVVSQELIYCQI
jgi:hypothetical protein